MNLPKYIVNKIRQQNEAVFKAQKLKLEIENWCDKSGIDIYSDEYIDIQPQIEDAVGPIYMEGLKKIYNKINN